MVRKVRTLRGVVVVASVTMLLAAACGDGGGEAGGGEDGGEAPFTIGLSNGFIGSEWRTQMVADVQEVFDEYEQEGLVDELIVESADVDVNGQIQQIRNLISAGVDAIIVNPNSESALNAVFQEAVDQGVLVIATDQAVTSEAATNVVIDQEEWGRRNAEWLAGEVGQGGRIVAINGIAGHPANEARWTGASAVFQDAGIEVLTEANADWDEATAQQTMSDLLATYPEVDGVFTQDGMALGVYQALQTNDLVGQVVQTGEARAGYMQEWAAQLEQDTGFTSIGVVNPPGVAGTALRVAVHLLQGEELAEGTLDGNTLFVPIPGEVTNENFDEWYPDVESQNPAYVVDGMLTEEEVAEYFA
jgi:ribose transport system substrate-binding protein